MDSIVLAFAEIVIVVDLMMELQGTLEPDNAVSAFGKFSFYFLQWTRPAISIQKIMNSTIMCLSPEQIGEVKSSKRLI